MAQETIKEAAINRAAGALRMTNHQVQTVVDHYEKERSAVNRERKGNGAPDQPKHIGGGWYLMPDGETKVQGKKAAGLE